MADLSKVYAIKSVASGKYLKSCEIDGKQCLQFSADTKADENTAFTFSPADKSDNIYIIKSASHHANHPNRYWKVDSDTLQTFAESQNDDHSARFQVKHLDGQHLRLRYEGNSKFCGRHTQGKYKDCLFAITHNIPEESTLTIEEIPAAGARA